MVHSEVEKMDYINTLQNSLDYAVKGMSANPIKWLILIILSLLPIIPWIGFMIALVVILIAGFGGMYGASMMANPEYLFSSGDFIETLILSLGLIIGIFIVALILSILLNTFYSGYYVRILRGHPTLPEIDNFASLFTDGLKLFVIQFVYSIPTLIILAITVAAAWFIGAGGSFDFISNPSSWMIIALILLIGIFVAVVVSLSLTLLSIIGTIRFARTGQIGQAFNFSEIFATIAKIGWATYIIALLILAVILIAYGIVFYIIGLFASIVPFVGFILNFGVQILEFLLAPFVAVVVNRYLCLIYDSAGNA